MDKDLNWLATSRSDDELMERIENRQNYMPETIETSLAELQRRGKEFSDEELRFIREDIQAQKSNAATVTGMVGIFNSDYKYVTVSDPDAPLLYSRRAIYLFTFFFGALFGSIMMAINLAKAGKNNAVAIAILFGVGFTAVQFFVSSNLQGAGTYSSSSSLFFGIVAAYCLNYLFWGKYIGYSTFHRVKPVVVPLIIALALVAIVVLGIIYGPKQ